MGALSHNPTYRCQDDRMRKEFRGALQRCLSSLLKEYRAERVSEARHVANIEVLSRGLSKRYGGILKCGEFRIGAAQKALNLYLKYAWARGIIPEPPHCPIDSIVLDNIKRCPKSASCPICHCVTWTKMRTGEEYRHFIEKAREKASGQSLTVIVRTNLPITPGSSPRPSNAGSIELVAVTTISISLSASSGEATGLTGYPAISDT